MDDSEVADVPYQFDVKLLSNSGLECALDIQPMISPSSGNTSQISSSSKILATWKSRKCNVQDPTKTQPQRSGHKFGSADIRERSDPKNSRTKIDHVSVNVTHIVSPHQFYVHRKHFSEMKKSIHESCTTESLFAPKMESISLNTVYLIHVPNENPNENCWYRGVVRNDLGNDLFQVFYVDFGNLENVKKHR